jgi:hypothetical protein
MILGNILGHSVRTLASIAEVPMAEALKYTLLVLLTFL